MNGPSAHWPIRYINGKDFATRSPSGNRPGDAPKQGRLGDCQRLLRNETATNPMRQRNADGVANRLPPVARTDTGNSYRRRSPIGIEPLKPFSVRYDRSGDRTVFWIPNAWRGGDTDGRAALERRHAVHRPTQAAQALGPVEAAQQILRERNDSFADVLAKQHRTRVLCFRREENHPLTTLRHSESPCIDNSVRPRVPRSSRSPRDTA